MNPECQRADINRDGTVSSIDVELATMSWRGNFLQSCRQQGGAGGGGSPSIGTPPSGSSRDAGRDTRSGRATAGSQPGEFESCLPCTIKSRADFNGDHIIDGVDLAALLACADDAGQDIASCLSKDLSGDGVIDEVDAGLLQAAWGSLCNSGCR